MFNKLPGKRNKSDEDLSYYKDEPGGATSKVASVLFGLFALFVTLLIASAVFFGGRAVYRALTDDSTSEVSTPVTEEETSGTQEDANNDDEGDQQAGGPGSEAEDSNDNNSDSGSTPTTGDTPADSPSTTPRTGDTPSRQALPQTGDAGL